MCLYPKLIKNPKYKPNKKNGGQVPPVNDERVKYVPIGCQNCIECRKQKAREWQIRLQEDIKTNTNAKFITLTFNNESISKIYEILKTNAKTNKIEEPTDYQLDNEAATWATRHFLERWRKKYKKSLRHWLVTELGHNGTENIHMHGIIWTNESMDEVEKQWQYGWIWKGKKINDKIENYVNAKTINYIIKYVNKTDEKHPSYKSIILTSPGIGNNYTNTKDSRKNKYNENKTIETYRTTTGHKMAMPIYYRNKIYTEEEKEKLWINKIDKQERYVLGEKISVKNGEEKYTKALEGAQKINKQLGYGDNIKNWKQEQYEKERRQLKQTERIQKAKQ
ncbi:MAG: replication initiator protein [Microviridae sp.]|nr:MAG: replication initiator protein [Microviridae sp.]